MTNKTKIFAQNWVEQWRIGLEEARFNPATTSEILDISGRDWRSLINCSFSWCNTREYAIDINVWANRWSGQYSALIR